MTMSELVAIGRRLEELERPKARANQALGPGTQSYEPPRRTSEIVGEALDLLATTYPTVSATHSHVCPSNYAARRCAN